MGKVFWTGAVNPSDESDRCCWPSREGLRDPPAAFVGRAARPSGRSRTCCIRDVSYGQIPRADRSEKHRRAAEWIARQGRPEDHAELLAHHWGSALRLAEAAGLDTTDLRRAGAAGAASRRGSVVRAERVPVGGRRSTRRLSISGRRTPTTVPNSCSGTRGPLDVVGIPVPSPRSKRPATRCCRSAHLERAAEAETHARRVAWLHGRRDAAYAPSRASAGAHRRRRARRRGLASSARRRDTSHSRGRSAEAITTGYQALAMADALGLDAVQAHALSNLSIAKRLVGDPSADDDLARSIEIARAANSVELGRALNNQAMGAVEEGEFTGGRGPPRGSDRRSTKASARPPMPGSLVAAWSRAWSIWAGGTRR